MRASFVFAFALAATPAIATAERSGGAESRNIEFEMLKNASVTIGAAGAEGIAGNSESRNIEFDVLRAICLETAAALELDTSCEGI